MSFTNNCSLSTNFGALTKPPFNLDVESVAEHCPIRLDRRAVCSGAILTLLNDESNNILYDIEFDSDIIMSTWDKSEHCIVLADNSGSLHLVTDKGTLLFSKKIVTGIYFIVLIYMTFC